MLALNINFSLHLLGTELTPIPYVLILSGISFSSVQPPLLRNSFVLPSEDHLSVAGETQAQASPPQTFSAYPATQVLSSPEFVQCLKTL